MKKLAGFLFIILALVAAVPVGVGACQGISDEIVIEGSASWQAQAFEGVTESYKCTELTEVARCGDDLRIEDSCELKITDMYFVGIAANTMANASLCRTGTRVGGEGVFMSDMYLDVVVPLPWYSWAYVYGSSMSYVNVWAH